MSPTNGDFEKKSPSGETRVRNHAARPNKLDDAFFAELMDDPDDGRDPSLPGVWRQLAQSLLRNYTALEHIGAIMAGPGGDAGGNLEAKANQHGRREAEAHAAAMAGLESLLAAASDPARRAGLEAACRCAYGMEHLAASVQRGWTLAVRRAGGKYHFTDEERAEIAQVNKRLEELVYWTLQVMRLCFSHISDAQTLEAARIAKNEAAIAARLLEGCLSGEWRHGGDGRSVLDTAAFLDYMTTVSHIMEHLSVLLERIDDAMLAMCAAECRELSNRRRIGRTSIRKRSAALAPRPVDDAATTLTRGNLNISDYVQADSVLLNLEIADKDELLERLLDAAEGTKVYAAQSPEVRALIRPMLMERERYGSTAIGHGILFPHARVPGFNGILLLVATCRRPLAMPTPDDEAVFMTCLAVVPADRPSLALKLVSALSSIFVNAEARDALRRAETPREVVRYIAGHDLPLDTVILVRDLSRPYEWTAAPTTPVREIARQLLQFRMPGVAVLGDDGTLLGEITLTRLERFGLPNFFMGLQSVSFVRQFDPFEQYFLKEAQSVATDIMNTEVASLPEDGTLMEAIHALAVKRRAMVHVVRDGKGLGYVDNGVVLNRVLSP